MNTILFDLDGTLIPVALEEFVKEYFERLADKMEEHGFQREEFIKNMWKGINSASDNDSDKTNEEVFWLNFMNKSKPDKELNDVLEGFYKNEFTKIKEILKEKRDYRKMIDTLKKKGYSLVLATNPLFPLSGVEARLNWVNLNAKDFTYITTYDNSYCCKPNLKYYKGILEKIGKNPEECLMVGNNVSDDMCIKELGTQVYLITDYIENPHNQSYDDIPHGSFVEFEKYINGIKNAE